MNSQIRNGACQILETNLRHISYIMHVLPTSSSIPGRESEEKNKKKILKKKGEIHTSCIVICTVAHLYATDFD